MDHMTFPGIDFKFAVYGLPLLIEFFLVTLVLYLSLLLRQLTLVLASLSAPRAAAASVIQWQNKDTNQGATSMEINLSTYTHHFIMIVMALSALWLLYKFGSCFRGDICFFPTFQLSLWSLIYRLASKLHTDFVF